VPRSSEELLHDQDCATRRQKPKKRPPPSETNHTSYPSRRKEDQVGKVYQVLEKDKTNFKGKKHASREKERQ